MSYRALRTLLFHLEPETAHGLTLRLLAHKTRICGGHKAPLCQLPTTAMGLRFSGPLGFAAGIDKNAEHLAALAGLGVNFLEVGAVTPLPQEGNPRPRLFRFPAQEAIINRMGFNNQGGKRIVERLRHFSSPHCHIGVNIGKNRDTPLSQAAEDYCQLLTLFYPYADYFSINLSSPNTPSLRQLQHGQALLSLLDKMVKKRQQLAQIHHRTPPLALKISPDLSPAQCRQLAAIVLDSGIEGIIATNSSQHQPEKTGWPAGGLSGAPLMEKATRLTALIAEQLQGRLSLIACGGILSAADAQRKLDAGADLLQLYSGLVYRGPQLLQEIADHLSNSH